MPAMQTLVQNQVAEVQRLKELVNHFLLMSQLKADALSLNKRPFSLADTCLEIIDQFGVVAKRNRQVFKIELLPDNASFMAVADAGHVFIILRNLVENATKYGEHHSVISFQLHESKDHISVCIQNKTKTTIENVNGLKDEFARSEQLQEGFGLGLWIADQLAVKNGLSLELSYTNYVFCAELIMPFVH